MSEVTIQKWTGREPTDLGSADGSYFYLFEFAPSDEEDWVAAKQFLADKVSTSYSSLETLHDSLDRFGLATLLERVRQEIPTYTRQQKSEFGEIVCQLIFEDLYRLFVPVKHRYKDSPNVAVHGMDVIAFRFDPDGNIDKDTLYLAEVKTSAEGRNPPSVAYEIRDSFREISLSDISSDLQYLLDKMVDELADYYERVLDFHDPYELHNRQMRYCPFLVRDKRLWSPVDIKCIREETYRCTVSLTVVTFENLNDLALEIYRLARGENE